MERNGQHGYAVCSFPVMVSRNLQATYMYACGGHVTVEAVAVIARGYAYAKIEYASFEKYNTRITRFVR